MSGDELNPFWSNPKNTTPERIPKLLKMAKKPSTAEEKRHMGRVAALGCLICNRPSNVHHCGTYAGGGRDDMKTIPLCHWHHQNGGYGVALHAGKKEWQRRYGTEEDLLIKTHKILSKQSPT